MHCVCYQYVLNNCFRSIINDLISISFSLCKMSLSISMCTDWRCSFAAQCWCYCCVGLISCACTNWVLYGYGNIHRFISRSNRSSVLLTTFELKKILCISIFSVFASEHHEGYSDSWIHYAYSYSGAGNAGCPEWKGYAGLCWNGKWQNGCIQHSDDTGLMWWNLIFPSFIMWSLIEYVAQFYLFIFQM